MSILVDALNILGPLFFGTTVLIGGLLLLAILMNMGRR